MFEGVRVRHMWPNVHVSSTNDAVASGQRTLHNATEVDACCEKGTSCTMLASYISSNRVGSSKHVSSSKH